ncbi:MAG: OadG family protein [Lachnospiraceae bacterium]|nr:OadG family protein [Lachnospiraceae bacterium]
MKKFLSVLCVCICLFGLTACDQTKPVAPEDEEIVVGYSEVIAGYLLPEAPEVYGYFFGGEITGLDDFTNGGAEYTEVIFDSLGFPVDGNGFLTGIESWKGAVKEAGSFVSIGESTVKYGNKGDTLIVDTDAQFENKDAVVEFIFEDGYNKKLTSFAVNLNYTFGEKMEKAGLNTLLGMGIVFIVLILLTLLIGCFDFINKAQSSAASRKKQSEEGSGTAQTPAGPVTPAADAGDDEIAAVIAAAIAAYESESGSSAGEAGGYFVRSIKRSSNSKWNKQ